MDLEQERAYTNKSSVWQYALNLKDYSITNQAWLWAYRAAYSKLLRENHELVLEIKLPKNQNINVCVIFPALFLAHDSEPLGTRF